jgi:hypothetical protein
MGLFKGQCRRGLPIFGMAAWLLLKMQELVERKH